MPILGNTNDTKNSQSSSDIDDGTKVSDYVAWYLGGVDNRAEYPASATTPEGLSRTVDFSGPTRRLLPSVIQEATRSATVNSANSEVTYTDSETEEQVTEAENHNQIVACAKSNAPFLIGNCHIVLINYPTPPLTIVCRELNKSYFRL